MEKQKKQIAGVAVRKRSGISPGDWGEATPEQLEEVARLARRPLAAEEVYLFPVVLCDNEVDRDGERFDDAALETLSQLFVGKTGVFDHQATAASQSARIFRCGVEEAGTNSLGLPYRRLRAWAYMVRCPGNADLILEIDAGIKKEVSVGCAVAEITCSVCGADQRAGGCGHRKGQVYDGGVCHHVLANPTDAYEWSFVAVPAQPRAGVTKAFDHTQQQEGKRMTLEKLFHPGEGEVQLGRGDLDGLEKEYRQLRELARAGEEYLDSLRRDVVKLTLLSRPGLEPEVMEEVAGGMALHQLLAFQKAFARELEGRYPSPQLAPMAGLDEEKSHGEMGVFRV